MGIIYAIANQKGGVGKTTTTVNLAACLAEKRKKVLMVDMDPQGNATSGFGLNKEQQLRTSYEVLLGDAEPEECTQYLKDFRLSIIPSNMNLAGAEVELIGIERGLFEGGGDRAGDPSRAHRRHKARTASQMASSTGMPLARLSFRVSIM